MAGQVHLDEHILPARRTRKNELTARARNPCAHLVRAWAPKQTILDHPAGFSASCSAHEKPPETLCVPRVFAIYPYGESNPGFRTENPITAYATTESAFGCDVVFLVVRMVCAFCTANI